MDESACLSQGVLLVDWHPTHNLSTSRDSHHGTPNTLPRDSNNSIQADPGIDLSHSSRYSSPPILLARHDFLEPFLTFPGGSVLPLFLSAPKTLRLGSMDSDFKKPFSMSWADDETRRPPLVSGESGKRRQCFGPNGVQWISMEVKDHFLNG